MSWTDERIEKLTKMWEGGATASQIADVLGGVSRNAVLGKLHRLGLAERQAPARPGAGGPRSPRPKPPPAPQAAPQPPPPRRSRPRVASAATAPSPPLETGTTDLLGVGGRACRWPIGDPLAPGFTLCGRPASRGAYCAVHGARAYRPAPSPAC